MQKAQLRFGKGFKVAIGNKLSQSAQMVLEPGETEGGPKNHHRGADQWLFVVSGVGVAIVNKKRIRLAANSLILIERGDDHEIRNTGKTPLCTLNFYVPPAYTKNGDTLPPGKS